MTTRKPDEATTSKEAAKPKAIRNNYRSPLQLSDSTIIPAGASIAVGDVDALAKNRTVAAWLKAGVMEVS